MSSHNSLPGAEDVECSSTPACAAYLQTAVGAGGAGIKPVLNELLRLDCCPRCSLRLCGATPQPLATSWPVSAPGRPALQHFLQHTGPGGSGDQQQHGAETPCPVCLGVLQSVDGPLSPAPASLLEALTETSGPGSRCHGPLTGTAQAIGNILR